MPITIGSNVTAMQAMRALADSTRKVSTAQERLASGMRINKASDDAAGLAISEQLNSDSKVFAQGVRNINDGISALNIAGSALESLTDISIRQRELATQAANGTFSDGQRENLDKEVQELWNEYNRIIETTEFGGIKLLANPGTSIGIQAGYGLDGRLELNLGQELARTVGDGTFETDFSTSGGGTYASLESVDLNSDGNLDIISRRYGSGGGVVSFIGNGNGTFQVNYTAGASGAISFATGDFNGDGFVDAATGSINDNSIGVHFGNGDGTFTAVQTLYSNHAHVRALDAGDINNDGIIDLVAGHYQPDGNISYFLGNGDGSFQSAVTIAGSYYDGALELVDLDGDSDLDIIRASSSSSTLSVLLNNGNLNFSEPTHYSLLASHSFKTGDFNLDGIPDLITAGSGTEYVVSLGDGDGSFSQAQTYNVSFDPSSFHLTDLNDDGITDFVSGGIDRNMYIALGNGDGTFTETDQIVLPDVAALDGYVTGDFDGDSVSDVFSVWHDGTRRTSFIAQNTTEVTSMSSLDVLSVENARSAMTEIDGNLERISRETGNIGSMQSRLLVARDNLSKMKDVYKAAEARIVDADIAQEAAELLRGQILQQAGAAVLAQANQQPSLSLALLG